MAKWVNSIFPCRPGGKLPATAHGNHDATIDAAQIRQWERRHADRKIGLSCTGMLVLDISTPPA